MDSALDNLQKLICHKTQTTNQPTDLLFRAGNVSNTLILCLPIINNSILIVIICLQTFIWFNLFLSYINYFQTDLVGP